MFLRGPPESEEQHYSTKFEKIWHNFLLKIVSINILLYKMNNHEEEFLDFDEENDDKKNGESNTKEDNLKGYLTNPMKYIYS